VREQLEHDRVIRLLQAKYKRKFEVAINPGHEQTVPVMVGTSPWYPDLVLQSTDRSRKLLGTVEVETAESVNNLEAMSQWASFGKLRAPFHLYVPASNIDTAKRLCTDLQINCAEIWAYNALGDQMRFTLVHRSATARVAEPKPRAAAPRPAPASAGRTRPARPAAARPARAASAAAPVRRKAAAKKTAARPAAAHLRQGSGGQAAKKKTTSRTSRTQKRK
jgi:hypothetical protein